MKTQIWIIGFLLMTLAACKKDDKANSVEEPKIEVNPNTLKIELDIVSEKDDELIIFWKDASIAYFDAANTVYAGIKGSAASQKVMFEFEEGIVPNDIRIDISSKKEQTPIKLNGIKIYQQDRVLVIDPSKFDDYFVANDYAKYDKTTGMITFQDKDGMHDPFFTTKPAFLPEFEKVQNTVF